MKIGVPRETADGETRVALTPQIAGQLVADGHEVLVQAGAGDASSSLDDAYREAGATIVPDAASLYSQAEMVLRVGRPSEEEVEMLRSGSVLIGTLGTLSKPELAQKLAERGVTAISMDAIPRITRAQSMDTLSSQATVGGYKAVLIAADRLPKFFPLLTTAAGTIRPARGIVMGAGVAGLMAIGTARRLGAVVEATDVRPVVKEQVESLGGTFIEVEMTEEERKSAETAGGYATEMSEDYKRRQAELIAERVKEADFIITTALIPRPSGAEARHRRDGPEHEARQRHRRHGRRDGRQRRGHRAGQGGRQARRADRRAHEPAVDDAGQRDPDVREEHPDARQAPHARRHR